MVIYDSQNIGNLYFKNAINNIIDGRFKQAYIDISKGFSYISCDCELNIYTREKQDLIAESIKNNSLDCKSFEFDFIRSILFYFEGLRKSFVNSNNEAEILFNKALFYIDSYIENNFQEEVGHYIKGRILLSLNNNTEGIKELEISLEIKPTARTLYRIGKYKYGCSDKKNIEYLYQSILLVPLCSCALLCLKNSAISNNIRLESNTDKYLVNIFNNLGSLEFHAIILVALNKGEFLMDNGLTLPLQIAFNDFLISLRVDEALFYSPNTTSTHNYTEDDYFDNDNDNDNDNDYNLHYEKYGGYNDYDDDTIDDAFEGNPLNTWNVD